MVTLTKVKLGQLSSELPYKPPTPALNVNHFLLLSVQKVKIKERRAAFETEAFWDGGVMGIGSFSVSHTAAQWAQLLPPQAVVVLVRRVWRCMFYCVEWTNKTAAGGVSRSGQLNSWIPDFWKESRANPYQLNFILLSLISFFAAESHQHLPYLPCVPRLPSRYRHTLSLGSIAIMCGFCKPPQSLEATKGCADCKSNFCNECFKLYHPWGTPRAQHEHILPTNNFRPKVWLFLWFFYMTCRSFSSFVTVCSSLFVL